MTKASNKARKGIKKMGQDIRQMRQDFSAFLDNFYANLVNKRQKLQNLHKLSENIFYILVGVFVLLTFSLKKPNLTPIPTTIKAELQQDDINFINNTLLEINKTRQKYGLTPLQISSTLQASSLYKEYFIFSNQIFAHDLPNLPWQQVFKKFNLDKYEKGEVLAVGITEPKKLVLHWLSSQTHKQVLLNQDYNAIGISVVHGEIGGQNTVVIVAHLAKLPQDVIDNTIFPLPFSKIYTNVYTKYINFSNKQGRVVVMPNITLENSNIQQTFSTINGITAKDFKPPYINFNLKTFKFIAKEQLQNENRIEQNDINIKPVLYQAKQANSKNLANAHSPEKAPNTPNLQNKSSQTTKQQANNVLEIQVNIPKKNLNALVLGTKITKSVDKINNIVTLQIIIAIFALAISAVYAHTAPENKKKYILVEIFWAIIIFGASLTV